MGAEGQLAIKDWVNKIDVLSDGKDDKDFMSVKETVQKSVEHAYSRFKKGEITRDQYDRYGNDLRKILEKKRGEEKHIKKQTQDIIMEIGAEITLKILESKNFIGDYTAIKNLPSIGLPSSPDFYRNEDVALMKGTKEYPLISNENLKGFNGKATFVDKSSNGYKRIYMGDFKNGLKDGEGTLIWSDGDEYKGSFKNNKANGKGIYTEISGYKYKYEGEYRNNKPIEGKYTREDIGGRFEGRYKNGIDAGEKFISNGVVFKKDKNSLDTSGLPNFPNPEKFIIK